MLAGTDGVSGPRFVAVYGVAAALVICYALLRRAAALRDGDAGRPPTPPELAYLIGGPARAVHSALAGLRAIRAIDTGAPRLRRRLRVHRRRRLGQPVIWT